MTPLLSQPRALLAALALLVASACTSPCLRVQQQLCACRFTTNDARRSCEASAENQERLVPPDADALTACEAIDDSCAALISLRGCAVIELDEGKRACGLAEN